MLKIHTEKKMNLKETAPILPLRRIVIFPSQVTKLTLARKKSIATAERAMENGGKILLVPQLNPDAKLTKPPVYHTVGVLATIFELNKESGMVELYVTGQKRVLIDEVRTNDAGDEADFEDLLLTDMNTPETEAYFNRLLDIIVDPKAIADTSISGSKLDINPNTIGKNELVDELASRYPYSLAFKLLNETNTMSRLEIMYFAVKKEMEASKIERDIQLKVRQSFEKSQKEAYLRETMSVIQKELGIGEEQEEYKERIKALPIDEVYKDKLVKDLDRLVKMPQSSAEYTLLSNYLDFVLELPWNVKTEDNCDLKHAKDVLDRDHFGLDKIKDRILEFLAVHHLTETNKDPILCFVGPPGVGKTTIVRSIADSLNRKYVRMSLGGVHDEAEIRGHRKTYIGAMAGRILNGIKQGGSMNPVFLLDEIDKLAKDFRGDPSAALLEVLDPELNWTFRDNYLEMPFDLKDITFITTANSLESIPPALADRMEIIEMSGYTPLEKIEIAKRHLIPKQMKWNGVDESQIEIEDGILERVVSNYTKEAGVRQLEKVIAKLMRKSARIIVETDAKKIAIKNDNLQEFLGVEHSGGISKYEDNQVGCVMGLAWTGYGGDILPIEVATMRGKGEILLTGKLGDVLKESARTAISYLRSNEEKFGLDSDCFKDMDIHIHIPEGAVSKDGPSAGVTLATAVYSAITGKKVRHDVAMTGEITLRGMVLPIGGLKEKVLSANRNGIFEIVAPFANEKDLIEIPKNITEGMKINFVKTLDEVFDIALVK